MIQSRYPFIAVETVRGRPTGDDAVPGRRRPARPLLRVDGSTNGLQPLRPANAIYDSQQPLKGLNNVAAMTGEAIFLMKDLHRYLADAAVARKCLDLAPAFGHDRRVIVMSAVRVELPSELEPLTARFTLDPAGCRGAHERSSSASSPSARVSGRCRWLLSSADLDRLVDPASRLHHVRGPSARFTQAILRDNTLDARDIDLIVEIKKEMLRKDSVLEYVSPRRTLRRSAASSTSRHGWRSGRRPSPRRPKPSASSRAAAFFCSGSREAARRCRPRRRRASGDCRCSRWSRRGSTTNTSARRRRISTRRCGWPSRWRPAS